MPAPRRQALAIEVISTAVSPEASRTTLRARRSTVRTAARTPRGQVEVAAAMLTTLGNACRTNLVDGAPVLNTTRSVAAQAARAARWP